LGTLGPPWHKSLPESFRSISDPLPMVSDRFPQAWSCLPLRGRLEPIVPRINLADCVKTKARNGNEQLSCSTERSSEIFLFYDGQQRNKLSWRLPTIEFSHSLLGSCATGCHGYRDRPDGGYSRSPSSTCSRSGSRCLVQAGRRSTDTQGHVSIPYAGRGRNLCPPLDGRLRSRARGNGWTKAGRAGGETIRPITLRRSS